MALGILATALVILLESHYGSLRLFDTVQETELVETLLTHAIGVAELEVLSGSLDGEGDFGRRLEDYSYSFSAEAVNETDLPGLIEISVVVRGPDLERKLVFMTFDGNQLES